MNFGANGNFIYKNATPSIQTSGNINSIHIRRGYTFQFEFFVLGGGSIGFFGKQIMPWSYYDGGFHLDQMNCRWNNLRVTFLHAVSWIPFILAVIKIVHVICKDPHADISPVYWIIWSSDNTHHMVPLIQVMPSNFSTVPISERTEFVFNPAYFLLEAVTYQHNPLVFC